MQLRRFCLRQQFIRTIDIFFHITYNLNLGYNQLGYFVKKYGLKQTNIHINIEKRVFKMYLQSNNYKS